MRCSRWLEAVICDAGRGPSWCISRMPCLALRLRCNCSSSTRTIEQFQYACLWRIDEEPCTSMRAWTTRRRRASRSWSRARSALADTGRRHPRGRQRIRLARGRAAAPAGQRRRRDRSADTAELPRAVEIAVRTQFRPGFRYAKAGAVLSELQAPPAASRANSISSRRARSRPRPRPPDPRPKLMRATGTLDNRLGRDSVRIGSTTMASRNVEVAVSATKQERRTPRYTTRWDERVTVRA